MGSKRRETMFLFLNSFWFQRSLEPAGGLEIPLEAFMLRYIIVNYLSIIVMFMGKLPLADKEFASIWVCKKCSARNPTGAKKCRKCHYTVLRPKRKAAKGKKL